MLRRIRELFNDVFRQADLVLLALCIGTSLFGILMIASATHYMHTSKLVLVQAAALCIGAVLYIVVSQVDLNELAKYWKWIFLVGVVFILLLATPLGIAGDTGNKAWLEFPFLPVKVQPAEIVKLTFIIVLAKQLSWLKENRDLRSISSIVMLAAHFGVIFALYYKISSDMGSALVFLFIFACMCFVAGVALRWFLIGGGAAGLLFYAMWDLDLLDTYMKNRFIVLFDHSYDPLNTGWQQTRSLLTLGGGRIFGQGLFRGTQTQSEAASSLPHRHTDFIFSVIGEELGLVGACIIMLIFAMLLVRGFWIALHARDRFGNYTAVPVCGAARQDPAGGLCLHRCGQCHYLSGHHQCGYVPVRDAGHRTDAALHQLWRLIAGDAVCLYGAGVRRTRAGEARLAAIGKTTKERRGCAGAFFVCLHTGGQNRL